MSSYKFIVLTLLAIGILCSCSPRGSDKKDLNYWETNKSITIMKDPYLIQIEKDTGSVSVLYKNSVQSYDVMMFPNDQNCIITIGNLQDKQNTKIMADKGMNGNFLPLNGIQSAGSIQK
jgi:hypothetical protein